MRTKLKVVELRELPNDKGYVLAFQTTFGEELGSFYNKDVDPNSIKSKYPIGEIKVLDVVPYSSKGSLGLSVVAPLTTLSEDELF